MMIKKCIKKYTRKTLNGYTLIEVLISISILSVLFLVLAQSILTIYKANQYITTLNSVSVEANLSRHIIRKVLISAAPDSVVCNPPAPGGNNDINNDGQADKFLLDFKTFDNKKHYLLVLHRNEIVPYSNGALQYNKLVLYKYNDSNNKFEEYVSLTNPSVTFTNLDIECSPLVDDKLANLQFIMVTLKGNLGSLDKYMFIPKLHNQPIVKDYPFYQSILVAN